MLAEQKGQKLTVTPFAKHHEMLFDKHLVETIVYNLLSNAIKYTPEKGNIKVTCSITSHHSEDGRLTLTVEDDGPGISQRQQEELFKPFVHGYVSHGGMGIGLYIAYQMAIAHKGTLTYERVSQDGGSRFTLQLPTEDTAYSTDEYNAQSSVSDVQTSVSDVNSSVSDDDHIILDMQGEALNDINVAIIEDDPDIMQQIRSKVGVYFNTVGYSTGKAGCDGIIAERPSLIICDVMLPDITGYEVVQRLKADSTTASIPVIMLTALDDEDYQMRAYKAGADDFMVKPCNYRLLIARAMQLIKGHATYEQAATAPSLIESRSDKIFLEKLEMLTLQHLGEATFSVDRMAEMMNMGRTKFYGKVKTLTSMSPNRYLQDKRMKRAADLLLEGTLTVSEVAYKVGLQDPSYFNKLFKAYFGVVPSKYGK